MNKLETVANQNQQSMAQLIMQLISVKVKA